MNVFTGVHDNLLHEMILFDIVMFRKITRMSVQMYEKLSLLVGHLFQVYFVWESVLFKEFLFIPFGAIKDDKLVVMEVSRLLNPNENMHIIVGII